VVVPYSIHQVLAVPLVLTVPLMRAELFVIWSTPPVDAAGAGSGGGGAPVAKYLA
jgi:hypothetical protein